jgi:trehalose 6-phosphate phosphatase
MVGEFLKHERRFAPSRKIMKADREKDSPVPRDTLPSALDDFDAIVTRIGTKRPALFVDYDGTLTPIVQRPEWAVLARSMRDVLRDLTQCCPVAVISGRDLANARELVGLDDVVYAGSHGFDIEGPAGIHMQHDGAKASIPDLDAAEKSLGSALGRVAGALLERKRFTLAVHFRNVAESEVATVAQAVDTVARHHERLEVTHGKKVFELRPRVDWDKGKAVSWLFDALGLDASTHVAVYIGDDITDEDAFRALRRRGIGIAVGDLSLPTHATYRLEDADQVERFLRRLASYLDGRR